jgi:hypothetical protein
MGSGYKQFTAGAVLTASEVNNYLMEQSVMTFGGSATRSSAIGTANFEEGMVSYLTDTDKLEVYNGTNWVSVAPTTSQGLTLINTTSFSAVSSQRVNPFSATYQNYRIVYSATQSASTPLKLRLASGASVISTSTYRRGGWFISSGGSTASFFGSNAESSVIVQQNSGGFTIDIFSPFEAAVTHLAYDTVVIDGAGYARISGLGHNTNATSYDGIEFSPDSGTITGTVRVYGYNN